MSRTANAGFNPRMMLAVVCIGFLAFLALLYFIGVGDTGDREDNGEAHAAARGLNGYAGLARLLELDGYDVTISRSPSGLDTNHLLVLTPPANMDAEAFADILEKRTYQGPTIVILPKWFALGFPETAPQEVKDKVKDGWVRLIAQQEPVWVSELPEPYAFSINGRPQGETHDNAADNVGADGDGMDIPDLVPVTQVEPGSNWIGFGIAGQLPDSRQNWAPDSDLYDEMVVDSEGRALVLDILGEQDGSFYNEAHTVIFVVEPDLLNNYGLANQANARLASELFLAAAYDEQVPVVLDLTLNGLGGTTNLLTLAFKPPFLAATLCLILALVIVGWRGFNRFGPPVAEGPAIAFGKRRLVSNGAGLILRARRTRLLAKPFVALRERRIHKALGLMRHDREVLDAAIAARLPDEPSFSDRADALLSARRPNDILRAARALHELERTLTR